MIARLLALLPNENDDLQESVFRLILNLSHDGKVRSLLVKHGILGKLLVLFENDPFSDIVISLLYQISIDDQNRGLPLFQECIPSVIVEIFNLIDHKYTADK